IADGLISAVGVFALLTMGTGHRNRYRRDRTNRAAASRGRLSGILCAYPGMISGTARACDHKENEQRKGDLPPPPSMDAAQGIPWNPWTHFKSPALKWFERVEGWGC